MIVSTCTLTDLSTYLEHGLWWTRCYRIILDSCFWWQGGRISCCKSMLCCLYFASKDIIVFFKEEPKLLLLWKKKPWAGQALPRHQIATLFRVSLFAFCPLFLWKRRLALAQPGSTMKESSGQMPEPHCVNHIDVVAVWSAVRCTSTLTFSMVSMCRLDSLRLKFTNAPSIFVDGDYAELIKRSASDQLGNSVPYSSPDSSRDISRETLLFHLSHLLSDLAKIYQDWGPEFLRIT